METQQRRMRQLADEVAKSLGSDWKVDSQYGDEDSTWRAVLERKDGLCLFLSNTWAGKGRLHIGSIYPKDCHGDGSVHPDDGLGITVVLTKPGDKIAADITRRLLPEYEEHFVAVMGRHNKMLAHKAEVKDTATQVAEIIGGHIGKNSDDYSPTIYAPSGSCFYHALVHSEGQVSLKDFTVTVDQLKRLKQALPELFSKAE